ncbi:MAG: hypothetical protein IKU06_11170 [Lachnospiraceae bacterium]|nr:hypothetical protein [Lachnospiraceae bacterium]
MKIKELFKDKKTVIRVILFVAAIVIAATMFSRALLGLSRNKEGYQAITANPVEDALVYANGFTFNYYFSGSSGEIKEKIKEVTAAYSNALCRAYKQLDADEEYNGYNNIATLNRIACSNPASAGVIEGEPVKVSDELFAILKDAYYRTLTEEHYNMFAGDLYGYISSILVLNEPQEFDPAINADTADRLERLKELVSHNEYFNLEFLSDTEHTVRFSVDKEYFDRLAELEIEPAPLNIGILKDAYMVETVRTVMEQGGYTDGYLTTQSGLTLALSKQSGLNFCIYGVKDENVAILDTVPSESSAVYCAFKAFGFGNEAMYYAFAIGDDMYYRCPYFSLKTGYDNGKYLTLYSFRDITTNDIYPCADAVMRTLNLWCDESGSDPLSTWDGYKTYYVTRDDMGTVIKK